jgi:ATP-binding protein involved in chromosome partitioning
MMVTKDEILQALKPVEDPELHKSIVDLGMVENIQITGKVAIIKIKLTIPEYPLKARISEDVSKAVSELDGIDEVRVEFGSMNDKERENLRKQILGEPSEEKTPHIADHILAISSGKGGVGKSTVTTNLARALAEKNLRIGVLDADVYGFSIPKMLGIDSNPTIIDNMIIPIEQDSIKVISMGFFVPEGEPVVWRGPLLHKAISQFIADTVWGELDVLLMDLPPGTGDVSITIGQKLPDSQMIVVTTPQLAAVEVASRVAAMAKKTNIPVLGVIENMSYYLLPDGNKEYIFGQQGGHKLADKISTRFLGEVPLLKSIREYADSGKSPFDGPDSGAADPYRHICTEILNTF